MWYLVPIISLDQPLEIVLVIPLTAEEGSERSSHKPEVTRPACTELAEAA